jgi:hypothetical protein
MREGYVECGDVCMGLSGVGCLLGGGGGLGGMCGGAVDRIIRQRLLLNLRIKGRLTDSLSSGKSLNSLIKTSTKTLKSFV